MKISHILQESPQQCPECGGPAFGDLLLAEKKDACYSKVRSRYKVWPSAYASGALVQCRKKGAANWGNKSEGVAEGNTFDEPLTGYHIVYKNSGNPVLNTPSFETKDQAQKYLMTKMFANHQDFKVVHTANVGVAEGDNEKIAGRHDPEEFDAMVSRLRQLAGSGPLKTVWDEKKRVYRNVPVAQQPNNNGSRTNA